MCGAEGESTAVSIPPDGDPAVTRPRVPAEPDTSSRRIPTPVVAAVAGCLAVVAVLGIGVAGGFGPELRLDYAVSRVMYVGDHRSAALGELLQVLTSPGSSVFRLVLAVPVLVLLARRRLWRTAVWVLVAVGLIGPLTTACKELVGRLRPQFADGGARIHSMSFPSGHSSGIATTVTVGLLLAWPLLSAASRRVWLGIGAVIVLVVGLTRMWLGVHYLTDVVAGWCLGVAWTLLTALLIGVLPGGRAVLRARS
jgi:undecaprenyl-diphosphatase